MPIHLTCDFCDDTTTQMGQWRVQGPPDQDVVVCPACWQQYAGNVDEGWEHWEEWDHQRRVARQNIIDRHHATVEPAIEADCAAWLAAHPEPAEGVDWVALLQAKRGAPCAVDADDTCEVPAVDPASWQEVRYWYATCTRCFGDCEGM